MAHRREAIRKAIVSNVTGLATTGANVFNWSLYAESRAVLPSLAVEVAGDPEAVSATIENEFGDVEARDLPVRIVGRQLAYATGSEVDALDTVDDICEQVEEALTADRTQGLSYVLDTQLVSTSVSLNGDGTGEAPVASVTMDWLVRYSVNSADPSA